jgi:predicted SprT family Zn-dependent metalloprotease
MGIKDRDGRWLSMLGGRRYLDRSELLWQLNREGLAANSLGTVMRSYFIEHEIAHGSRRMYIEGGTPHPIKFSFVPERLTDLVVLRRSLMAKAMQMVARHTISPDNELSHMLSVKDLTWQAC